MKLVFAVIRDKDANEAISALNKGHIGVTKLSSTGGFLRDGNTTLMIGTEDDKVDECLALIASRAKQRKEVVPSTASYGIGVTTAYPLEVTVGGATVFVTNVERFEKL